MKSVQKTLSKFKKIEKFLTHSSKINVPSINVFNHSEHNKIKNERSKVKNKDYVTVSEASDIKRDSEFIIARFQIRRYFWKETLLGLTMKERRATLLYLRTHGSPQKTNILQLLWKNSLLEN